MLMIQYRVGFLCMVLRCVQVLGVMWVKNGYIPTLAISCSCPGM